VFGFYDLMVVKRRRDRSATKAMIADRVSDCPAAMVRLDKPSLVLAAGLSAVASYVDAVGLRIVLGSSVFESWQADFAHGLELGVIVVGLLVCFVVGVAGGSLAGGLARKGPRLAVLAVVTLLLAVAAGLNAGHLSLPAVFAVVLAVGASNSVFQQEGNVHVGLLFLMATLVGLGESISAALTGSRRTEWGLHLLLFLTTAIGAVLGWSALPQLGTLALWIAAGATAALALLAITIGRKGPPLGGQPRPLA
jgi:uncharacterized membrane protein YoaK (UPF0700 family)